MTDEECVEQSKPNTSKKACKQPPKRGRGRPAKNCVQMTNEECVEQPKLQTSKKECEQPLKRGRGRPSKNTK